MAGIRSTRSGDGIVSKLLITGGRVIDPAQNLDRTTNVLVDHGRIAGYDVPDLGEFPTLPATGKIVAPGFVDLHVQLREPGCEEDETIETGTRAALAGGFTSIACLPQTEPPLDTQASVEFVRQKALRANNCHVYVLGCVSKNREGKELAEIGSLVEAGAVGFTDAMLPLHNDELLRRALEYCRMFDKPVFNHCEVPELARGGVMHEGRMSLILGLAGMPSDAEDIMTSRDIRLCESTGGRMHLLNVSCSHSIDMVHRAKERGVKMTAGICPWNFAFSEEKMRSFNPLWKLNPPLRSASDVAACITGLVNGTIDVISSGHAPRASEKKMQELDTAPFGMVSLETTLAMINTYLIQPGKLSWLQALEKLTINPAHILKIHKGHLRVGAEADIAIIDPQQTWQVDKTKFCSKSSNSPLLGEKLIGKVTHTLIGGEVKYQSH
jgi:dihydroorotase